MFPDVKLKILHGTPHEQVPLFVNACNAVLVTSTHEGWPNIVKEALACNVPFVSTDVSDLNRIAASEASCHVAEPRPEALADCLVATLRFPRPRNLRRHVRSMDVRSVARQLVDLYEQQLGLLDHSRSASSRLSALEVVQ